MERAVMELIGVIRNAMADAQLAEEIFADTGLREQLRRNPRAALGAFAVAAAHVTKERERVIVARPVLRTRTAA